MLNPSYLPYTRVRVTASSIRLNERNKESISFVIEIYLSVPTPSASSNLDLQASWKVEKSYSEVLVLDAAVKAKANKQERSAMGQLPDKSLFKDHAPHKSDQRKVRIPPGNT
jgi:RalA-binding protein 1